MQRNVICASLFFILALLLTATIKSAIANYPIPQIEKNASSEGLARYKVQSNKASSEKNNEFGDYYYRLAYDDKIARELSLRMAADYYRAAIQSNPSKADYLVKLLYTKARQGQVDGDFYSVYEAAFKRGGFEYHILRGLLEVGFSVWYALDSDTKKYLELVARRLYTFNSKAVLHVAMKYGQLNDICLWTADMQPSLPLCRRVN